jgi:hypothetical protein
MKSVIRKMDRALKRLYNLEHSHGAEAFLIHRPILPSAGQGAFFIHSRPGEDLEVGIFLDKSIRKELSQIKLWNPTEWAIPKLGAFAVAAEEVSHFNYFIHHRSHGRPVSQLELELQGEIDKFLLTLFSGHSLLKEGDLLEKFERLLEQFFQRYQLVENLSAEQRGRYEEASQHAKRFLLKHRAALSDPGKWDTAFRLLRRFYRLNLADKLSLTNR